MMLATYVGMLATYMLDVGTGQGTYADRQACQGPIISGSLCQSGRGFINDHDSEAAVAT